MRGRGREAKETLARKPHDFEKLRSPTNAAFDWCGAGSVDYLALEISIKPSMFCLRASHIYINFVKSVKIHVSASTARLEVIIEKKRLDPAR